MQVCLCCYAGLGLRCGWGSCVRGGFSLDMGNPEQFRHRVRRRGGPVDNVGGVLELFLFALLMRTWVMGGEGLAAWRVVLMDGR